VDCLLDRYDMSAEPNSLDVGCGFSKGEHKKKGDIGIDLNKGVCDVVADAQNLPFRNNLFDKIFLYAILEHLDDPIKCLKEAIRVSKSGASFEILIPVEASHFINDLKRMLLEFPFGLRVVLIDCWLTSKYGSSRGFLHKNRIQPNDISRFLKIRKVELKSYRHAWFNGRKGKLFEKIFGVTPPEIGVWKNWYIKAQKGT